MIKTFKDKEFDCLFTMAVSMHIVSESEWLFNEMVRISKYIFVLESETQDDFHIKRRNYKGVFEELGCRQLEEKDCSGFNGLKQGYMMRMFKCA